MVSSSKLVSTLALVILALSAVALTQTDPGVQNGNRGTGAALSSVLGNDNPGILSFFNDGQARFQAVEAVSGGANNGLGPRFNLNQCSGCHAQPVVGGSGAAANPQFQAITEGMVSGATNSIPSFITANGPTREARFPFFFNISNDVGPVKGLGLLVFVSFGHTFLYSAYALVSFERVTVVLL